ncbi:teichoic acid biosynthesis protein C [Kitasatospora sp. NPDC059571]|uniref:phage baseplate protein n=1 Tax=Kitasatospora sp. NPDC059571 TaxID=3346871 RepID=UPI0036786D3A
MTAPGRPAPLGRRRFLLGTAAALAAAGCAPAPRAVPGPGPRFDLAAPAARLLRERPLWYGTLPQSFAVDPVHGHLYVTQAVEAGVRLPGDDRPAAAVEGRSGDLCVNRLDLAGNRLDFMRLKGFGHGVGLGVEQADGEVFVWTEADVNPASGYGRALARTRYVPGAVLSAADTDRVTVHRPVPGSTANQPALDPVTGRLAVRYRLDGRTRYRVHDLADARRGAFGSPLAEVAETDLGSGEEDVFQGFAVFGDFVYRLLGTAYGPASEDGSESGGNPKDARGNASVSAIDLRTGEVVERVRTEAAWSLDWREPEGIAVDPRGPRLYIGFGGGQGRPWTFTVYAKDRVVGVSSSSAGR